MFIPFQDSPNPVDFKPWVNYALLAINIAVFVLITLPLSATPVDPTDPRVAEYLSIVLKGQFLSAPPSLTEYNLFVFEYGFKPATPELIDLFASMFLHGGFMHLAGNMLFLWIFGDNVEHRLGRPTYLGVYIGTGIVATLTFAMFASTSFTPLVGASGAISGVLGLYFLFFPRNEIRVFIFLFPFIMQAFWIRAPWVLGFYVIVDNILPFVLGTSSNVAYGAHLGGFFAGLGVAWFVESSEGGQSTLRTASPSKLDLEAEQDSDLSRVEVFLQEGRVSRAIQAAYHLDATQLARLAPQHLYIVARGLADNGADGLAGRALRKALNQARTPEALSILHLALGELRLAQGQPAAAYQHLLAVLDIAPNTTQAGRAETALRVLRTQGEVINRW